MSSPDYIEPLSRRAKLGVLAVVIFFHVGVGWALTSVQPQRLVVGEMSTMQVSIVPAEAPPEPQVQLDIPVPEDTPPPEVPQLESMIQPPMPDLPPPAFPVEAPPPKPPQPKPPPKPAPPKVQHAAPTPAPAQSAPPSQATAPAGPVPIPLAQLAYLNPPNPIYPARSRRAGEQGTVMLRVVIDPTGLPVQVTLARSSGHPALDESAISAMRAARVRPLGQLVVVDAPITFNLQ